MKFAHARNNFVPQTALHFQIFKPEPIGIIFANDFKVYMNHVISKMLNCRWYICNLSFRMHTLNLWFSFILYLSVQEFISVPD